MSNSTFTNEVFHAASPTFAQDLTKGSRPPKRYLDMHHVRGYADSRASAGSGALWRLHFPILVWSRGQAFGAIQVHPCNPGGSYLIDCDFLVKVSNYLRIERVA